MNGEDLEFEVEVDDLGEPSRQDVFTIRWLGYSADGVLQGGNIQIQQR